MNQPGLPEVHDLPDRMTRERLAEPANLRELIAKLLPNNVDCFRFDQMQKLDREFLLEDWRGREADLLVRLPYVAHGQTISVLICMLIEHQSKPDPRMPLRMLLYAVLFWDKQWREWEALPAPRPPFRLTPVLPIVFHTGPTPWNNPRSLADLMELPPEFASHVPSWQLLMWDLATETPEALLKAGAWFKALAVIRADREDEKTFADVWQQAVQGLRPLYTAEHQRWYNLMKLVLDWAMHRRAEGEWPELHKKYEAARPNEKERGEVRNMITMAQRLYMDGEIKGEIKGKLQLLMKQGTKRFGMATKETSECLRAIDDPAVLEDLAVRLLDANSWEDLLAGLQAKS